MRKITFLKTMLAAVMLLVGSVGATAQSTYNLVTSTADLVAGAKYLIVSTQADGNGMAMGLQNTNNRASVAVTVSGESLTVTSAAAPTDTQPFEITLGGTTDQWTLYDAVNNGYLFAAGSGTNNYLRNQTTVTTWTISFASNAAVLTSAARADRNILRFNSSNNPPLFSCYASGQNAVYLYKLLEAVDPNTVAIPTYSPLPGNYFSPQNVTISSATVGATIRYTTNGDEPTESSAVFSTPISVSTTTTIKAKAYKTDMTPSATTTATYILPTEVSTLAAMRSAGPGVYRLTGEVVLSLKTATRNAKYVQDATGAVLIDDANGVITTSYNIGDGITGLTGTTALFNGMLQFTPAVDPGNASSTGNAIQPVLVELDQLGNYEAHLVKVKNVIIEGTGNFTASTTYNLNGGSNPVIRTQYSDLDYIGQPIPSVMQDIVGVVLKYNTTNQLVPRSLAEITNTVVSGPTIIVRELAVPAMSAEVGSSDTKDITVSGVNLTGDISLSFSGANANYFSATPTSIAPVSGTVTDVTVAVTYTPLAGGSHTATLTLSSPGATNVTRTLTGTATAPPVQMTPPNVIITEVYGAGGNSGAVLNADFIELYNTTDSEVNIGGWSVQYYSATGTTTNTGNTTVIPDGKIIPAKGYFLIKAAGGANGDELPTPDAEGGISAAATAGKVILFTTGELQTISDIASITGNPAFKDYVPYGTTATPVWGSAMSSNISTTTSATRKMVGEAYSYTQNIGFDFEPATPSPTNSGITSVRNPQTKTDVYAVNGSIRFHATAGQLVEVYNVIGQKVVTAITRDGLNSIPLKEKGMMVVRIGEKTAKVIL